MTPELRRIIALPRALTTDAHAAARFWTRVFSKSCDATLRPVQGLALEAAYARRGLYLSASVGAGKTLLAWLLFAMFEAERGVYVAPAGLLRQTQDLWTGYASDWLGPPAAPLLHSYEELDNEDGATLLADIAPDVLVIDESHSVRRWERTATRRIHRALDGLPDAVVACMTATPGRQSIVDHWHQLVWCLGDGAPVPRVRSEAMQWAAAIDLKPRDHAGTGVLSSLDPTAPGSKIARARAWYRDRLASTPGVILDSTDSCSTELVIRHIVPPVDPVLEAAFKAFREEFVTPGGEIVGDPLEAYRLELQLGVGYYGRWTTQPPVAWLRARKAWRDFVRARVAATQRSRKPLDTEAQVARAHPDAPQLQAWLAIRDHYTPRPKPTWVSSSVIEWAAAWAAEHSPCLVWAWGVPTCEALANATGLIHYGRKGLSADGDYIGSAPHDQSAIVSGQANLQGRNLQGWHRALYLQPPQSAQWLEQAFGRMHRSNQTKDVEVYVAITSARVADGMRTAADESRFGKEAWGADQKLLRARNISVALPVGTYRWA